MPGFFTDYTSGKVLDLLFGSAAYTPPATLYLGLSYAASNRHGAVSEPSGGGYARVPVPNNPENFPAASGGIKANSAAVAFPEPTSGWGEVATLFVADAASGGNVIAMADLAAPTVIKAGGPPARLAAGALLLSHA